MSHRLKRYAPVLKRLHKQKEAGRRKWLKQNLDKDFVECICECTQNLLRGNVPLTKQQKAKLGKRKKTLRKLIGKKLSLKKRKQINQSGGFLGALIGPIVSVLSGLLGGQ